MSFWNYFFLFAGASVAMILMAGTYFCIVQYKTFFKVLEPFFQLKMPRLGTLLTIGCLCAGGVFYANCPDKTLPDALNLRSLLLITVALGVAGLIPQTQTGFKIVTVLLQMAACAGTAALLPADSRFLTLTALPYWGNFVICALGIFAVFRLFYTFNAMEGFFLQQSCVFGMFFAAVALFFPVFPLLESQFFLLISTIFIAGIWFYLAGIQVSLTQPALHMLSFIYAMTVLFLMARHRIASAVMLSMYPLTEFFVYACRWFVAPFTKKEAHFIYRNFLNKGVPQKQLMFFIFRRNCIFVLLAVMGIDAQLQLQPIVLGVIVALDFYTRSFVSLENKPETLKGIFKQMKKDAGEDWAKSKEQIRLLKNKYADRKKEKSAADDNG